MTRVGCVFSGEWLSSWHIDGAAHVKWWEEEEGEERSDHRYVSATFVRSVHSGVPG